jgi:hypothetical protein
LILKEPITNIVFCSIYGAMFMVFSKFFVSIIYESISSTRLDINVNIYLFLALLLTPILLFVPPLLIKSYHFFKSNIKK